MPRRRRAAEAGWLAPRTIVLFLGSLLAFSAVAWGLGRLYAPAPVVDLTPQAARVPGLPPTSAARSTEVSRSDADGRSTAVDPAWLRTTAAKAGIPIPALRAYADAQVSDAGGCQVGWTTLAGIGWVESHHGTIGGRTLGDDGVPSPPIIGPALDGTHGFAAIRSTPESQAWHGDATWEHAVGPMQFLRSSFDRWATDGDGDGVANPQDIDDAAATTARYLCASGQDLSTGSGWAAAIFSYNHSQAYVDDVYAAATAYAQRTG